MNEMGPTRWVVAGGARAIFRVECDETFRQVIEYGLSILCGKMSLRVRKNVLKRTCFVCFAGWKNRYIHDEFYILAGDLMIASALYVKFSRI